MKKFLIAVALLVAIPSIVSAISVPWDRPATGRINPLYILDEVRGNYFTATSTTQSSTFPFASTTILTASNASTTNLTISAILSSLLKTNSVGGVLAAVSGTDYEVPLTFGDGLTRTANDIDCDTASGSTFGCLSSSDWTLFNNKVSSSSLSTFSSDFKDWSLITNTFGQSALAPTTTQNIHVSGTGTSTIVGGLEAWRLISAPYFNATSTATSTFNWVVLATCFKTAENKPCLAAPAPGGLTTEVQYNDAGSFAGNADFIWDNTLKLLAISGTGVVSIGSASLPNTTLGVTGDAYFTGGVGIGTTENFTDGTLITSGAVGIQDSTPSFALDVNGFINTDGTTGGYKQAGNTILFASSTNSGVFGGITAGAALLADGIQNTAFGHNALENATSTDNNTAVGYRALRGAVGNNAGFQNTGVGSGALELITSGAQNTALGYLACRSVTTANDTLCIGVNAGDSITTGVSNVALGSAALTGDTTGAFNMAIGAGAMLSNTTGSSNVGIGNNAFRTATSSSNNVAIGDAALDTMFTTTGNDTEGSVAIGNDALTAVTSAGKNIGVGFQAGNGITTGNQNLIIGYDAEAISATTDGQLNFGNIIWGTGLSSTGTTVDTDAKIGIGSSTPWGELSVLQVGTGGVPAFVVADVAGDTTPFLIDQTGSVGVASSTPWRTFSVSGTMANTGMTGATGGTNNDVCIAASGDFINETTGTCIVSSKRWKHDIEPLHFPAIALIESLNPVSFSPNEDDVSDFDDTQYGFIAEEVAEVDPRFAKYGTDGLPRTLDDRALLAIAIKAIQELEARILELEGANACLIK